MTTVLAGDIGGTKTLLALYRLGPAGELERLRSERFVSADWDDLAQLVRSFQGRGTAPPAAACLAVAGPVEAGQAQLTNLSWKLEEARLQADTAIPRVELVNDFAVLIHGLAHLTPEQQAPIRAGNSVGHAPLLVLGAGTGLGVAYGVPGPTGLVAMASEGAHGEFAPRSQSEWELKQWLGSALGLERVSIERVVSGTGLGSGALAAALPPSRRRPPPLPPAQVRGSARGGRLCRQPGRPAGGRRPGALDQLLWQRLRRSGPGWPEPRWHLAGGRNGRQTAWPAPLCQLSQSLPGQGAAGSRAVPDADHRRDRSGDRPV